MAVRKRGRPFLTADAETDPFKAGRVPEPFIWGVYDGEAEDYREYKDASSMLDDLRERDAIVYAHNGGKFDWHYIREHIDTDSPIMVINGRLARFRIGRCEFRDSINILPVSLDQFNKLKIDYADFEADKRADPNVMDRIRRYLRNDCVELWTVIQQFQETYGKSLTQAGSAMRYWGKHFATHIPRQTAAQFQRFEPYYFGGRVQAFETGVKECDFAVADINSSYPYAMQFEHPYAVDGVMELHLPPEGELHKCFVKIFGISKGALPWFDKRDGKLYFPDDERTPREYHVTGWEIMTALELDALKILRIDEVYRFEETVSMKDYIEHFYELRQDAKRAGDKARDTFAKLLMNSLYGKFGSDPTGYEEWIIADGSSFARHVRDGYDRHLTLPDGRFLLRRPLPEYKHQYYNIATAASVTGFARARLFKSMRACSGLIYSDTDSIAARDTSRLDIGPALGQWKIEKRCDKYAIGGRKLYAFRDASAVPECDGKSTKADKYGRVWKVASKGVKLSPDELIDVASGKTVKFVPDVPTYSMNRLDPVFIDRNVRRV